MIFTWTIYYAPFDSYCNSSGWGPRNTSINQLIDKEQCCLVNERIDDAIQLNKERGKGVKLCKTDISDTFKLLPITPKQWHLYDIKWNNLYYVYKRLTFDYSKSSKLFDQLSEVICWIAQQNYKINMFFIYCWWTSSGYFLHCFIV